MNDMYLFINESTIQKYENDILKIRLGNKITRVIANPSENHLKEFNYMELVVDSISESNENEDQVIIVKYEIRDEKIYQIYEVLNNEDATI